MTADKPFQCMLFHAILQLSLRQRMAAYTPTSAGATTPTTGPSPNPVSPAAVTPVSPLPLARPPQPATYEPSMGCWWATCDSHLLVQMKGKRKKAVGHDIAPTSKKVLRKLIMWCLSVCTSVCNCK